MDFIKIISDKRKILVLMSLVLIIGAIVCFYIFKKIEKSKETVPIEEKIAQEVLNSLTAPADGGKIEVSEDIINSLTSPK
ncbi:MAG: hypothetical protein ABH841_01560 [Candidatus Nealsonbacteria bacterium]